MQIIFGKESFAFRGKREIALAQKSVSDDFVFMLAFKEARWVNNVHLIVIPISH